MRAWCWRRRTGATQLKGVGLAPYRIGADFAPWVVPPAEAGRLFANFWRFSGLRSTPRPDDPPGAPELLPSRPRPGRRRRSGSRRTACCRAARRHPGAANDQWSLAVFGVHSGADAGRSAPAASAARRDRGPSPRRPGPLRRRRPGRATPSPAACGARRSTSLRRSGATRSGAVIAGAARLLPAEGHEHHREPPGPPRLPGGLEQHGHARGVVLGPGATATVSRCAPTSRYGAPGSNPFGRATTLADVPAPTGTPHESPAGTGKRLARHVVVEARSRLGDLAGGPPEGGPVASRGRSRRRGGGRRPWRARSRSPARGRAGLAAGRGERSVAPSAATDRWSCVVGAPGSAERRGGRRRAPAASSAPAAAATAYRLMPRLVATRR